MTERLVTSDTTFQIRVIACSDPYDASGDYVRRFWTSALGPSASALIALLVRGGNRSVTAGELGAGIGVSRAAVIVSTLDRLATFKLLDWVADNRLYVRSHLPRLNQGALSRMPDSLRAEHDAFVNEARVG